MKRMGGFGKVRIIKRSNEVKLEDKYQIAFQALGEIATAQLFEYDHNEEEMIKDLQQAAKNALHKIRTINEARQSI